jgi:hypothetical protein
LITSNRQYGFKKGRGCSQAIHDLKQTVDYYTSRDSTINIATLDISKAFDKINHYKLLLQLMKRFISVNIVRLLTNWYCKLTTIMKWNNVVSKPVSLATGVRQGGVLSPALFSVYIDDLLTLLNDCKLGCFIKGNCANSFVYADDIILLAISVQHLQTLVNLCRDFLERNDLSLNSAKCKCLRIGLRNRMFCKCIRLGMTDLEWVEEIKYLGVFIERAKVFRCNYSENRKKFFRSFNCIFGRVGKSVVNVVTSLLSTQCVPVLLYGSEAVRLNVYE